MKKIMAMTMLMVVCFGFVGCGSSVDWEGEKTKATQKVEDWNDTKEELIKTHPELNDDK